MLATTINAALILLGSILGLLFKNRISSRLTSGLTFALGLCVLGIGITGLVGTQDTLCVIVCMVVGTLLGEAVDIERRMEGVGELLRRRLIRGDCPGIGSPRQADGILPRNSCKPRRRSSGWCIFSIAAPPRQ